MIYYFIEKMGYAFITLLGVVTIVFFLFNVLPGDPAKMMVGQREDSQQLNMIRKKLGLDKPKWEQYLLYLNDISPISIHNNDNKESYTYVKSNKYHCIKIGSIKSLTLVIKQPYLRESFHTTGKLVSDIIKETLPNTFVLATSSMCFAFLLGILLGIIAALNKDTVLDKFLLLISSLGMSIPSFFSAILISWIFAFVLHEYTKLNMTGSLYEVHDMGNGAYLNLKNLILPTITLGMRPLSVITQLTRNSLLEVLSQDYIKTAYAKGLSSFQVIKNHAFKNSLNPVITATSGWFASLLAGAVFVEFIFGWNGLGKEVVNALNYMDLPVVMGSVLIISILFIIINIMVDILYEFLDPRVRRK